MKYYIFRTAQASSDAIEFSHLGKIVRFFYPHIFQIEGLRDFLCPPGFSSVDKRALRGGARSKMHDNHEVHCI